MSPDEQFAAWYGSYHGAPAPQRILDTFRKLYPTEQKFSWWDYRMLAFPKNQGLRIDHIFATAPLVERLVAAGVDRDARKGKQPSDHAPVIATFEA